MMAFRFFLLAATVAIYTFTVVASASHGINWPAVAVKDLLALNWRTQFDVDFIIYLIIFASWIAWREGSSAKGYAYGFLSIVLGGMFSFPYLLYATYAANGDMRALLLGSHHMQGK